MVENDFNKMSYVSRESTANSKPLGTLEVNGQHKEYYIPAQGVPDLYVEGISEPIIKVEVDFVQGRGWKATNLLESPRHQNLISQISEERYKYYVEEVASYVRYLNQSRPNG